MSSAAADEGPLVYLVAGEPSGDQLGARLMAGLKEARGGAVRFAGIGGPRMTAEGLESLFPIDELSVMGLVEVVPHLRRIVRRVHEVVADARRAAPDIFVTIDSPSFTLQVSRRLNGIGCPRVHYVAPQVWAWKPWRARQMAGYLDHVLALLPFEPPYFERHGLPCTFVGHPVVELAARAADGAACSREHGIPEGVPLVTVLPGSRRGEVQRLMPVFGETLWLLKQGFPELRAVTPTIASVAPAVKKGVRDWPVSTAVVQGPEDKYAAFAASNAALAASGTVAVELAVAGVTTVIAYRVSGLSAAVARRMIRVRFASLVNILLDREVQPEFLQGRCRPDRLARKLGELLYDPVAREAQLQGTREAVDMLSPKDAVPSRKAAEVLLSLIDAGNAAEPGYIEGRQT